MVFSDEDSEIINSDSPGLHVGASNGHVVRSYVELLQKIAALSYWNQRFSILFRGQPHDYNHKPGGSQIVRWAILQYYKVCPAPLFDVTKSLQTALSFATSPNRDNGFLYVFGFPQLTGVVSISIESMTQVVDLSQLCPPQALHPHFQTAFLAGDYPAINSREQSHGQNEMIGNNFSCRLLAKFRLTNCSAWVSEGFKATPQKLLFPNRKDEWYRMLAGIKAQLKP